MHPRTLGVLRSDAAGGFDLGLQSRALRGLALALCASALVAACGGSNTSDKGPIGSNCLTLRDDGCASALCLVLDSSTAYCTQPCQAQTDCPDNYLCLSSSLGTVCQSRGAGGVCSVDADCPAGLQCDTNSALCYIAVTRSACGACTSDKQCGTGGTCHNEGDGDSFCAPACGAGNACPSGYLCAPVADGGTATGCLPEKLGSSPPAVGSCRGGRPLCAACTGDIECGGPGDLCVRNLISGEAFCGVKCDPSTDGGNPCASNFSCTDLSGRGSGPYQCVPNSGTCAGYCDGTDSATVARECGLGATCTNNTCQRLTDGSLCAACTSDNDCATDGGTDTSARCVDNQTPGSPFLGETFCGRDCSTGTCPGSGCGKNPSVCPAGFECAGIGTNGAWPYQCAPVRGSCEGGLQGLGESCAAHGADDCISGICAQFGTENDCSLACTQDTDCQDARWRCCKAVGSTAYDCSQPANGSSGICAPVGGSFGDDCSPGNPPCENGTCLDLGTAQICSQTCGGTSASCPSGFTCEQGTIEGSDTTSADGGVSGTAISVCFPNGGGAVGADCTFGPAACTTHLCLKKDSGNVCTQTCVRDTDCPTTWSCLPVNDATDNNQSNVCVPAGTTP